MLNPSFTGYDGTYQASTSFRYQKPTTNIGYLLYNFSFEQSGKKRENGLGFNFRYQGDGDDGLITYSTVAVYAPSIPLFKEHLVIIPSLAFGTIWNKADWAEENVDWGDGRGPGFPPEDMNPDMYRINLDWNIGILFTHHNFIYGVGIYHDARPNLDYGGKYFLTPKYNYHISYVAKLRDKLKISPTFIYAKQHERKRNLPVVEDYTGSVTVQYKEKRIGIGIRNFEDVYLMLGYSSDRFTAGYSFEFQTAKAPFAGNATHEIAFNWRFGEQNLDETRKGAELVGF